MYTDFYQLTARPFQLSRDPTFFFEAKLHKKARGYLTHGFSQCEGFIFITGEIGAAVVKKSVLDMHTAGQAPALSVLRRPVPGEARPFRTSVTEFSIAFTPTAGLRPRSALIGD